MQDDRHDDVRRIGNPVIAVAAFAFKVSNDGSKILRLRNFGRLSDLNFIQRVPAGGRTVIRRRFKLDDLLSHLLSVSSSNSPVFGFDIVDDAGLGPAAQKRGDDKPDALTASRRSDNGQMFVGIVTKVIMGKVLVEPKEVIIDDT